MDCTQNRTELVFILDRSGSMAGLEQDTIGGYNALLKKQQDLPGECCITTVLFDDKYELLHDRIDLQAVRPITGEQYYVRGCTALLDAIGRTISKIGTAQKNTAPAFRADSVMVVITTDGMENASREYDYAQIRRMVEHQREKYGWEVIFLGANIDAVETAGRFGVAPDRAQNYHADSRGTQLNYSVVSDAVKSFRQCAAVPKEWNAEIQADFEERG